MNMTLKNLFAALVLSLSLGVTSSALAQDVAPININTANEELLAELPGIGPSRAAAIVEEREANGDFESADDLTRVSGIGEATVDRMRDQVVIED
ncbi:ComEA family DNA-binding protein [Halomonas aquamarina]|uniref:ComEA family DNA-binding protein n=1 Tax=Vreelandella aquamarina TaxID=77097 RepID=A0ACC5VY37_9GAMM|nr:ComEA family DNA-binding protein [Halomonas aquamarina]MBZ5489067.1 ComEA family DNA-binding protein [Halomonas aquamarina]